LVKKVVDMVVAEDTVDQFVVVDMVVVAEEDTVDQFVVHTDFVGDMG